jgi:uncharacterized protein YndB with AHSA1/START domain
MKTSDSTVEINAPAKLVWRALTMAEFVKQWQYGSELITTWNVGSSIVFRNEWDGKVFEQKGTVLEFVPESHPKYSLFFPRPGLEDAPENYFFMTYRLTEEDGKASLLIRQEDPRPIPSDETSDDSGPDILAGLKSLVETKMQ